MLPWSTPFIISGLLVAGWQGVVLQIIILTLSVVIYYPFFRKQDTIAYENEQAVERGHKEAKEARKKATA